MVNPKSWGSLFDFEYIDFVKSIFFCIYKIDFIMFDFIQVELNMLLKLILFKDKIYNFYSKLIFTLETKHRHNMYMMMFRQK